MDSSKRPGSAALLVGGVLAVMAAGVYLLVGPRPEPDRVTVAHILVSFAGASGSAAKRSQAEAGRLARSLLTRAQYGENFESLMKSYTDDPAAGIYSMCNRGLKRQVGEFPREDMVQAFGDLSFKLKVGAVGLAPYDPQVSPFGWHIIKRLK